MGVRLWPSEYGRLGFLSKGERLLLRSAEKNLTSGHFAVDIDPMHIGKDFKIGMYISPKEGLVTFCIMDGEIDFGKCDMYLIIAHYFEKQFRSRLLDAKVLIARNDKLKTLRFPYKHMLLFPEQHHLQTNDISSLDKLNNIVAFDFFRPMDFLGTEKNISQLHIFGGINHDDYDSSFSHIDDVQAKAIFERLAPEYTVVMPDIDYTKIHETADVLSESAMYITGNEVEYRTFYLDKYQVALVNDMGRGHRVILANPGSGKSVLLLARAFKYSSLYKKSKILLTCYNNNLANSYQFKEQCAGFKNDKNLYIYTFHKFVAELLRTVGVNICKGYPEEKDIIKCLELIKAGKIDIKFKAIFIDEVQIFDPIYIEICYRLLEPGDDSAFIMTGDLNQTVRALSKKGDVPWKKMPSISLDFKGRVRYIDKNYRNSHEISIYLKSMLMYMNTRFETLNMLNTSEYDYNQFKLGERATIGFKIRTGIKPKQINNETIRAIKEISIKYGISYSDIAIIFPFRGHKKLRYSVLRKLREALDLENIEYSEIFTSKDNSIRSKYSDTKGVVLSTIDSSLGLDFRAVVVCGLYPLEYVIERHPDGKSEMKKISSWEVIDKMSDSQKEKVQEQMRKIYTACSRARDVLYVISDLDKGTPLGDMVEGINGGMYD